MVIRCKGTKHFCAASAVKIDAEKRSFGGLSFSASPLLRVKKLCVLCTSTVKKFFSIPIWKIFSAVIVLLAAFISPARATGGFGCADAEKTFSLSAVREHGTGDSIYGDLMFNGQTIPQNQVLNYKSMNDEFYILIVLFDAQKNRGSYLEVDTAYSKDVDEYVGTAKFLEGQTLPPEGQVLKVTCTFE